MNKILLTISLVLSFCFYGLAQHGHGKGRGRMHQEIQAQKISFITQQLDLTPEEAQVFWPVYNQLEAKKDQLRNEGRSLFRKFRNGIDSIPDDELTRISDGLINNRMKDVQLDKEYHEKFKKILPIRKILQLYRAEKQFQGMLLRKIRERGHGMNQGKS